jgi:hypothetical protein
MWIIPENRMNTEAGIGAARTKKARVAHSSVLLA